MPYGVHGIAWFLFCFFREELFSFLFGSLYFIDSKEYLLRSRSVNIEGLPTGNPSITLQ
jgi:hypothetical protein